MDLPKFNETFLPILEILSDEKVIKGRELVRLVEERFYSDLAPELLGQHTKSGDRVIENRIAWGKSYLKKGGLVHYPERPPRACSDNEKRKSSKIRGRFVGGASL